MCRYVRVVSPPQMPALAEETVRYLVSLLMNEASRPIFWNLCCIREPDSNRLSLFSEDIGLSTTIEFDATPLPKSLAEAQGSDVEAAAWCSGVDVFLVVLDLSQECISSLWIRRLYHAAERFAPHASIQYLAMVKLIGDEAEPRYQDIRDYIDAVERRHRLCLNAYPAERSESLLGSLCYNDYFYRTEEIQGEAYSSEVLGRIGVAFAYSSVHTAGVMGYLEALLLIIRTLCHVRIEVSAEEHQVYNLLINTNMNFKLISFVKKWWSKLPWNKPEEIRIALVGKVANGKTYTILDLIHAIRCSYKVVEDTKLMDYIDDRKEELKTGNIKGTKGVHLGSLTIKELNVNLVFQDVAGEAFKDRVLSLWNKFIVYQEDIGKYGFKYKVQKAKEATSNTEWRLILTDSNSNSQTEKQDTNGTGSQQEGYVIEAMHPLNVLKDISKFDKDSQNELFNKFAKWHEEREEILEEDKEDFKKYLLSFSFIYYATDIVYCYLYSKKEEDNFYRSVARIIQRRKDKPKEYVLFRGLDEVLEKNNFKKLFLSENLFPSPLNNNKAVSAVERYGKVHENVHRILNPKKNELKEDLSLISPNCSNQLGNITTNLDGWKTELKEVERLKHVYFGAYPINHDGKVGTLVEVQQVDAGGKPVVDLDKNPVMVQRFKLDENDWVLEDYREPLGVFNLLFDILTAHDLSIPEDIKNDEVFSKIAGQP